MTQSVRTVQSAPVAKAQLDFDTLYETYFDVIWRATRRLGIAPGSIDDVVQEVFLVAYRRLDDFEHRSSVKTWLFGIMLRVVRTHRRTAERRPTAPLSPDFELVDPGADPHEAAVQKQAAALVDHLLDGLDDEKRTVFVMTELLDMSAPEIAEASGIKLNTVYSRLRAARKAFNQALERYQAQDARRNV